MTIEAGWGARKTMAGWLGCVLLPALSSGLGQPLQATKAPGCRSGYRLLGAQRDFALGRDWIIYANCVHPEMPRLAVADFDGAGAPRLAASGLSGNGSWAPGSATTTVSSTSPIPFVSSISAMKSAETGSSRPPEVTAGARVRLWKRDGIVAIDLAGTAMESGAAGARIRVRLAPGTKVLRGMVRGPGSVELDGAGAGFSVEGQ